MKKHFTLISKLLIAILFLSNQFIAQTTNINGPMGSGAFGTTVTLLTNGNYVVTDPLFDEGGVTDIGAVYLYNGITHALISTLKGSTTNDQVGNGGITALNNGNYVVSNSSWDNGAATNAGAVTWGNGSTGVNGVVSSTNSLVGSASGDGVGLVTALTNGNYVVRSSRWDNGAVIDAGAATWGNGTTGVTGVVSSYNSLVGSTTSDLVGGGITILNNGNYLVLNINWDNGATTDAGAVTWSNGTIGISGAVSSSNSLVGSKTSDGVGGSVTTTIGNSNYVVNSQFWDNGAATDAGAVTWGNGTIGISGVINSSNSLVGSKANDNVGGSITALSNGNYVVRSSNWDNGAATNAGAVTWGNGSTGATGVVSSTNSLVGSASGDVVGLITALTNGNYVVRSSRWDNGAAIDAGAVTWGNGTTGVTGVVNSSNSLVGSTTSDEVGASPITVLSNGNYIVSTVGWDNGSIVNAGSVTWGSGTTGISGAISSSNSLVGGKANDNLGLSSGGFNVIAVLSNGNYVVHSPDWDNGSIVNAGAVTWGNGTAGISGAISSSNSLVGSTTNGRVGGAALVTLTNGNYVVPSPNWSNGAVIGAGAVTWGNGTTGISGAISTSNSLFGSKANDNVGSKGITALSNGNYVVKSSDWDNGAAIDAGAATWGNGSTGVTGAVNSSNSLVGSTTNDQVGFRGVTALTNGNYVVRSSSWDNGAVTNAGAATWGNGTIGVTGVISSTNSLVGSSASDEVGFETITALTNGNYVVNTTIWDNTAIVDAGSVTWGNGSIGVSGTVNNCNSIVGNVANSNPGFLYNSIYDYSIVVKKNENQVSIFNPTGQVLGLHLDNVTQTIAGIAPTPFVNSNCRIIAAVLPRGASPIAGSVNAKTWVETMQSSAANNQFVKRHYEITPATAASTATGRLTLYFTQQEFDDFNMVSAVDLPTSIGDAIGISNLLIEKRSGVSSNGTGLPTTYSGTPENINPVDTDIVWNAMLSRWEISFDVTGFSGFFVKTISGTLPIKLLSFTGQLQNNNGIFNWEIANPENGTTYELLRSANGQNFESINTQTATAVKTIFTYTDNNLVLDKYYYKLKITNTNNSITYSQVVLLKKSNGKMQVTLYPNPATQGQVNVSISTGKILGWSLINASGQIISTEKININFGQTQMLQLPVKLTKGIYQLQLQTSNGMVREKLIIQ